MTIPETRLHSLDRATRRVPALALLAGTSVLATLALPGTVLASVAKDYSENAPLELDDAASGAAASGGADVGTSGGSIARVVIGLLVVVAAIYALTWVLKQVKRSKDAPDTGAGMEVVSTTALHGGSALQLVRVGDELLLLAVGANGATELKRYTEEEAREAALWPEPEPVADDEDGDDAPGGGGGGNAFALFGKSIRFAAPTPFLRRFFAALVTRLREMTVRG
jgi:flagellar biogenesis protein FliO